MHAAQGTTDAVALAAVRGRHALLAACALGAAAAREGSQGPQVPAVSLTSTPPASSGASRSPPQLRLSVALRSVLDAVLRLHGNAVRTGRGLLTRHDWEPAAFLPPYRNSGDDVCIVKRLFLSDYRRRWPDWVKAQTGALVLQQAAATVVAMHQAQPQTPCSAASARTYTWRLGSWGPCSLTECGWQHRRPGQPWRGTLTAAAAATT